MAVETTRVRVPEIEGEWLGREPLSVRALRGKAILIDFWDYTCLNCIRALPYIREWHRRYGGRGLVTIGVHAPEFRFARSRENVRSAVEALGVRYPVVLDNEFRSWQAFANRYWPALYLVDKDGYIRYHHAGEGDYRETEEVIQQLLREIDPQLQLPAPMEPVRPMDVPGARSVCEPATPELYLGSRRGRIANPADHPEEGAAEYRYGEYAPAEVPELAGAWIQRAECLELPANPLSEASRLRVRYSAAEANLVMAPGAAGAAQIEIFEDGHPLDHQSRGADVHETSDGRTLVGVAEPRMYSLVARNRYLHSRTLELASRSAGLELYAFTFVSGVTAP